MTARHHLFVSISILLPAMLFTPPVLAEPALTDAESAPSEVAPGPATSMPSTGRHGFHADAEIDPTAYAFRGYSVHVGVGYRHLRMDLGGFAMDIPRLVHGNDGFHSAAHGFGIKLQYFPFAEQAGAFVGIDTVVGRLLVESDISNLAVQRSQVSLGVNVGYRIVLPKGLYLTPWVGVSYEFRARDVAIDGQTYATHPIGVFPAVHLGYRFF